MDKVNVLYCFSSRSWRLASVSVESLLANARKSTQITIYCMVAPGTKGHRKINKIVKSHKKNAVLVWREIKPSENPFQQIPEYAKWGATAFYRCISHRFFKDVDKILYLNTYTLIYNDLSELFNTDISDCAFGAVYDIAQVNDPSNAVGTVVKEFSAKYLNNGPYYNSGVMLLNQKYMAEQEHLLFETKVPMRYPDQDLLNVAFVGKIKTLPLKYNLPPGIPVPSHFSKEEAEDIDAGNHVIVDCYYAKPYEKERMHKLVYETFVKYAKNVGMTPEMFIKEEFKYADVKKTFVPHVTIRQGKVCFFGIKMEK